MAITKNADRQYPLTAKVTFTQADLPTGVAVDVMDLPSGATVMYGKIVFTTAGDSVTSDTVDVGDGTTADRYISDANGKVAAQTVLTTDGLPHDTGKGSVYITNTAVGTEGTAMVGYLEVVYVIEGRGNESQPV